MPPSSPIYSATLRAEAPGHLVIVAVLALGLLALVAALANGALVGALGIVLAHFLLVWRLARLPIIVGRVVATVDGLWRLPGGRQLTLAPGSVLSANGAVLLLRDSQRREVLALVVRGAQRPAAWRRLRVLWWGQARPSQR